VEERLPAGPWRWPPAPARPVVGPMTNGIAAQAIELLQGPPGPRPLTFLPLFSTKIRGSGPSSSGRQKRTAGAGPLERGPGAAQPRWWEVAGLVGPRALELIPPLAHLRPTCSGYVPFADTWSFGRPGQRPDAKLLGPLRAVQPSMANCWSASGAMTGGSLQQRSASSKLFGRQLRPTTRPNAAATAARTWREPPGLAAGGR